MNCWRPRRSPTRRIGGPSGCRGSGSTGRTWPSAAIRGTGQGGQINRIKHTVNVNTLEETAASHLALNDVAVCDLAFDRPVPFDAYRDNPATCAVWRTSAGWRRSPG